MTADELPSWRETTAKQSVLEFVAAVTDRDSPDFVPERDRVAVFDNDGTLWTERPVYAQAGPWNLSSTTPTATGSTPTITTPSWAAVLTRSSPPPPSTSGP